MKISFTVFGHCEPQGSTKAFMPKGARFPVVTSDNAKLKPWRQQITRTAIDELAGEIAPKEQAVTLKLDFYVARPASKPKRITQPITRPDLDKYIRAVKDGLKGAAYEDDSQVCTIIAAKHYGTPERVEITVATSDEAVTLVRESETRTMQLFA
jgi:Holliday junction resolvase RusA-like endonuclease